MGKDPGFRLIPVILLGNSKGLLQRGATSLPCYRKELPFRHRTLAEFCLLLLIAQYLVKGLLLRIKTKSLCSRNQVSNLKSTAKLQRIKS